MAPSMRPRGPPEQTQHFIDPEPDADDITHEELPEEGLMEDGDGEEEDEDDGLLGKSRLWHHTTSLSPLYN